MDFSTLNNVQVNAIKHIDGAVVVSAGAGSGKTTVLTNRIAYMVNECGISPYNILAITFTNKASQEMKNRIDKLLGENINVWISTFHSMCVRILRESSSFLKDRSSSFSIFDASDSNKIIKTILKQKEPEDYEKYVKKLEYYISDIKNRGINVELYFKDKFYERDKQLYIDAFNEYEEELKKNNAYDFDDLLIKTYELLKENEEVRIKYANRFKYILVDEFQDTNKIQYELIRLLSSIYGNVFIVGDEDQCIYSWRGAESTNMQKFINDYPNVTVYKLEQNYRCSKKILDIANKIIKNNDNRLEKVLWTDNDSGVKVEYYSARNETDEAEYVVRNIYNLVKDGRYNYKDIAILVRLNSLSRNFEEKLLNYNMPYKIFGGTKFYSRLEIKNLLAYLKLLVNPKDNESFRRIMMFPKKGIGQSSIDRLGAINMDNGLMENLMELNIFSPLPKTALNKFLLIKEKFEKIINQMEKLTLTGIVKLVLDEFEILTSYDKQVKEDANRIENIEEFLNSVVQFEKENEDAKMDLFLQSISLSTDQDDFDPNENSVNIATIHAVKGLEFKIVFVVGLEEKRFPLIRDDEERADIQEERRLMYVAVTRAMQRLYLTYAKSRYLYGKSDYTKQSRFLKEIADIIGIETNPVRKIVNSYANGYDYASNTSYEVDDFDLYVPSNKPIKTAIEIKAKKIDKAKSKFNVGDRVSHVKFGTGIVIKVENKNVVIAFDSMGIKTLNTDFAPLTKI